MIFRRWDVGIGRLLTSRERSALYHFFLDTSIMLISFLLRRIQKLIYCFHGKASEPNLFVAALIALNF
jgi:hypothetical protein